MGARGVELSNELKSRIIKHYKDKKSIRAIARLVQKCPATVQKIIERYRDTGSIKNKARPGRPRKFDETEHCRILQKVKQNTKMSANKLQEEIEYETGKVCNTETIRRVLYSAGYIGPFVHRKRLDFAKSHITNNLNYWRAVIFSSVCQFQTFEDIEHGKVWRRVIIDESTSPCISSIKQPDNFLTLWGCMSAQGVGNLVIADTKLNHDKFLKIIQENVKSSASKMSLNSSEYIFQLDNDCKFRTGTVRDWLLYNVGKVLYTPSQSNDLNPMEQLWGHLDFMVKRSKVSCEDELRSLLERVWQRITPDITEELVASMPTRLQSILDMEQPKELQKS